jgi:hypothetical protein
MARHISSAEGEASSEGGGGVSALVILARLSANSTAWEAYALADLKGSQDDEYG